MNLNLNSALALVVIREVVDLVWPWNAWCLCMVCADTANGTDGCVKSDGENKRMISKENIMVETMLTVE